MVHSSIGVSLGLLLLGIEYGASIGRGGFLDGDGIFGGKGARYTTVVSRPQVATPLYVRPAKEGLRIGAGDPFYGNRAAVSGKIVGIAPQVRSQGLDYHSSDAYVNQGSLLGESLGLVPIGGGYGGYGSDSVQSAMPILDMPGFPRFESDGYIVHDQRGRAANTCPPGGCTGPAELTPDLQVMYDKYKRYYRNFSAGQGMAPPLAKLTDPVPFHAYDRVNGGSYDTPAHFTAAPISDNRAGRRFSSGRYGTVNAFGGSSEVAGRGSIDRVQLGNAGNRAPRDSFFGKIYDTPDVAANSRVIGNKALYTEETMPKPYGYSSRAAAADKASEFDDLPIYDPNIPAGLNIPDGVAGSAFDEDEDIMPDNDGPSRFVEGGILEKVSHADILEAIQGARGAM